MDYRCYSLGLFGSPILQCKDNEVIYIIFNLPTGIIVIRCNPNDKSTKLMKRVYHNGNYEIIYESSHKSKNMKYMNEDGSRFEGDLYKEQPFGFGEIYDDEGNKIYKGFVFEGKKVGFGEEYFADTHTVDYCGNFLNDKRHGWGITYDRNGNKLFEGDWRCGKNDFEEDRIVIEDNCKADCLDIHEWIKELVIGENYVNDWNGNFVIEKYPKLEKIVVKKNSMNNLKSLKICNCEKLKTIEIEGNAFWNVQKLDIESIFIVLFDIFISS